MVVLTHGNSVFDANTEPQTRAWDLSMREHHKTYQEEIHQQTYRLQKGIHGLWWLGHWNFPYRYQHRYLLLELNQKKQMLGEITDEEVRKYSKFHSNIRSDLRQVFSPWKNYGWGITLAIGAQVFGAYANNNITFRFGYTIVPLLLNILVNRCKVQPWFNTIQFVDWVTGERTARARAEVDLSGIRKYMLKNKEAFKPLADKNGVIDIRQALTELIALK